ncbi:GNAT family N-acetyltransferase [Gottfriedia acidiceleris]|uniref:GNAT family N-acetyltransferase n=1 Tax=Gottfriedia acidiceleris TaxID=371036 RepID=A0ABY4JQT9_9BACI|nr:GNAT family N-acetyltransferase [Gottfriedia acidiceleris]UPM56202.1 GNAT family N-acetyltransferase [Gottfriedia acidiceleris]
MFELKLKNGKIVKVRQAIGTDAKSIIDFYNIVGGETNFLSFGGNEFKRNEAEYETFLEDTFNENNSIILLVTINDQIISIGSINSSQKERTKHVGTLGIVVKKEYWGLSLGKLLMQSLIDWAKHNDLTRKIQLVTNEDNLTAIQLYKNLGFEIEGVMKEDTYINGKYSNTLMMGLFIK